MRILFVSHLPLNRIIGGGVSRVYHLLKEASRRHQITVITPSAPEDVPTVRDTLNGIATRLKTTAPLPPLSAFDGIPTLIRLLHGHSVGWNLVGSPLQQTVDRACSEQDFDIIHLSTPFLRRLCLPKHTAIVGDAQNVEWHNLRRSVTEARTLPQRFNNWLMGIRVRHDEGVCCRGCDVVSTVSNGDKQIFLKDSPGLPLVVVPNGVDTEFFAPSVDVRREENLLVFTGSMDYFPNEHGAILMAREIFPFVSRCIPDAMLAIVGANPSPTVRRLASRRVLITGKVPDVRPWFLRAKLAVVPLNIGGGTRLKILEAMAMGTPVVSTPIGSEGLEVRHNKDLLIADDPQSFALSVIRFLRNPVLCDQFSKAGRKLVMERYRWETIGDSLEQAYQMAAQSHRERKDPATAAVSGSYS